MRLRVDLEPPPSPEAHTITTKRRSFYIAMKDGVRLAIDLFQPPPGDVPNGPWPTLVSVTCYGRARRRDKSTWTALDLYPWLNHVVGRGFAAVVVDARGTGASEGLWDGPWSPQEQEDLEAIFDYLRKEPWCDGRFGMFGSSYAGVIQYFAAARCIPGLGAIAPQMTLFDTFDAICGGGIERWPLLRAWRNRVENEGSDPNILPVDEDPEGTARDRIISARPAPSLVGIELATRLVRSHVVVETGERPFETRSPARHLKSIARSGVAVLHLGGWRDTFAQAPLAYRASLPNPIHTVIGPWSHGERQGVDLATLHGSFFEEWLRGTGGKAAQERRIDFAIDGMSEGAKWITTSRWPQAKDRHTLFLSSDTADVSPGGHLLSRKPSTEVHLRHLIDTEATTGKTSRWAAAAGKRFSYGNLSSNLARGLVFDSTAMRTPLTILGTTVLELWTDVSEPDICLFATLADVWPGGYAEYITEGAVRLKIGLAHISMDLLPTGFCLQAGHRLRLALHGADKDNASSQRTCQEFVVVCGGGYRPSAINLPIFPEDAT